MKETIQQLAKTYHQEVIDMRRHMHMHPELSYEEVKTGRYISDKLTELGIPHEHGIADNGVVGLIEGKNRKKKILALTLTHIMQ